MTTTFPPTILPKEQNSQSRPSAQPSNPCPLSSLSTHPDKQHKQHKHKQHENASSTNPHPSRPFPNGKKRLDIGLAICRSLGRMGCRSKVPTNGIIVTIIIRDLLRGILRTCRIDSETSSSTLPKPPKPAPPTTPPAATASAASTATPKSSSPTNPPTEPPAMDPLADPPIRSPTTIRTKQCSTKRPPWWDGATPCCTRCTIRESCFRIKSRRSRAKDDGRGARISSRPFREFRIRRFPRRARSIARGGCRGRSFTMRWNRRWGNIACWTRTRVRGAGRGSFCRRSWAGWMRVGLILRNRLSCRMNNLRWDVLLLTVMVL
mmetsp:Transcript_31693/g.67110  ORF Transcript_31693/g.67110 Transcript_31693/m.67110 type:complete len:320 (+) Transcript_31693:105-1064(+)